MAQLALRQDACYNDQLRLIVRPLQPGQITPLKT